MRPQLGKIEKDGCSQEEQETQPKIKTERETEEEEWPLGPPAKCAVELEL